MRRWGNKVQNHCLSLFEFHTVYAGAYWLKIHGFSASYFACLIESEDLREEKRHIKQVRCKGAEKTNDTKTTHFLRINYSTNRKKIVKHNKAKCGNVIGILQ